MNQKIAVLCVLHLAIGFLEPLPNIDPASVKRGFEGRHGVTGEKVPACNGVVTLSGVGGTETLHTGYGTRNYGHNMNCSWHITVPTGWAIQLEFDYFMIEALYEFVSIYDGSSSADLLLGSFSSKPPPELTSSFNNVFVRFTSDGSNTYEGFRFHWMALPTNKSITCNENKCLNGASCYVLPNNNFTCGCPIGFGGDLCEADVLCGGSEVLQGDRGSVVSHQLYGQFNYTNNLDCTVHLSVPEQAGIQLEFDDFMIEASYEFVSIYDGSSSADLLLGSFSSTPPPVLTSSSNNLFVRFTSDYLNTYEGFRFHWIAVSKCDDQECMNNGSCFVLPNNNFKCSCPLGFGGDLCEADVLCGGHDVIHGDGGSVVSHRLYGVANYYKNLVCAVLISVPEQRVIQLEFDDFKVEGSFDFVSIYDGSSSADLLLGSFSSTPPPVLTSYSNNLFVRFTSDGSNTYEGFRFHWKVSTETNAGTISARITMTLVLGVIAGWMVLV